MKTLLLAGIAGLALTVSMGGAAQAQRMSNLTGAKLVELCTSKDAKLVSGCTAYIDGIADTSAFYQRLRPADGSKGEKLPGYICVPGPVTGVELRQGVINWYKSHTDQANRQASGIVLRALDEMYLCPGEQRRTQGE
ncbi:MAG: Rap1a/Tai family immunity protein [Janthinobacterium lividum]